MSPTPDFIQRSNAVYIEEQYERYRRDPAAVATDWAAFFAGVDLAEVRPGGDRPWAAEPAGPARGTSGGVFGLVQHYRVQGHLAARLDPLGSEPEGSPLLDPVHLGFGAADLAQPVSGAPFKGDVRGTLADLLEALRQTYCGPIGVEYMGITDVARREWLQEQMEPCRNRATLEPGDRRRILRQLIAGDGFEEFLHLRNGVYDETRQMQNLLIDTICSLGERITRKPL